MKKKNLKILYLIVFLCLAALFIFAYTYILQTAYCKNTMNITIELNKMRSDCLRNSITAEMTKDDFDAINSAEDTDTENYKKFTEYINKQNIIKNVSYFYTVKKTSDGEYVYVHDGHDTDDEDFIYPGTPVDNRFLPYIESAFSGSAVYSEDIAETDRGNVYTAFYPVFEKNNPDNNVYGVLCLEIDMESTLKEIESNNRSADRIVFIAILITFILIILLYFINHLIKKKKAQQKKQIQNQTEIIKALGREYSTIYLINLENENMNLVVTNGKYRSLLNNPGKNCNYRETITSYADEAVVPEDRQNFLDATRLSKLREKLQKDPMYDFNYRRNTNGVIDYAQIRFIWLESKYTPQTILAIRSVDEIVKKEIMQQQELAQALEKAKSAEKSKSMFLFNMSHDIRTPMNAIIGFNYLAQKYIDNKEKALDELRKAELSSNHLLSLINEVLDMAQIESGKMELNEQIMDINEHIATTEEMFRNEMEKKSLTFIVKNEIKTRHIIADSVRLKQIVTNLLSNSMKFTKPGGKVIYSISEKPSEKEGCIVIEIRIADTGIGMSEEFQKKIFSAFERERTSTDSGVPGTGLGLAIAQSIASLMDGTLTCSSELGKGTEFVFTVCVKAADAFSERLNIAPTDAETLDCTGRRVLLVEDNELNCEIAVEILQEYGFTVETAEDGFVALEMVRNSSEGYYDLIFMDIQMPHMDGYTATREIRLLPNEKLANIPIIAMTANAFAEDKKKAFEAGMNEHISKPIDMKELRRVFKNFL
ncbi:MAG: hybrid sensor histidine kinase/response regulator [Ruminococcus sp.]